MIILNSHITPARNTSEPLCYSNISTLTPLGPGTLSTQLHNNADVLASTVTTTSRLKFHILLIPIEEIDVSAAHTPLQVMPHYHGSSSPV